MGHGLFHHARRLDHLRQKHLAGTKQITHHAHASHQWPFDHQQRAAEFDAGFLGIGLDVGVDSLDQRVRKALLDRAVAPLFSFLFTRRFACALQCFAKFHQTLGGVGTAVQQHILDQLLQLRFNLFVHFEHAGIHDAHVHTGRDGVIQKRRMHRLANVVVAAKTERNVGDPAAHFRVRQVGLDPARGVDVVDRVVVVLLHAGGNGEDIGIEDDVFRRKADFVDQNSVGALADADLVFVTRGLALVRRRPSQPPPRRTSGLFAAF